VRWSGRLGLAWPRPKISATLVYLDVQRVEQMSAVFAVIAGLAILATGLIILPPNGNEGPSETELLPVRWTPS